MNMNPDDAARRRRVAIWLFSVCALVFCMVVLGGFTRLTGSGLSMTDWRPVTGVLPPLTESGWAEEFAKYRQSPQFDKVNSHMDVHAFKGIFWLEYLHRLLGRILGLAFFVPFVVFALRGDIRPREYPRYLAMFVLGGLQGLLGWYMVKSGLVDIPQVSQYRLTAHLSMAFLVFGFMFWVALSLWFDRDRPGRHPWFARTAGLTAVLVVTILSGGFVAGLRAGKIYNSFPLMGDRLIPEGLYALSPFWRNLFENATTVQFNHRMLALTTFSLIVVYWWRSRSARLPRRAALAATAVLHTATLQVLLGISTLLLSVPILLGAMHQAVAMLLLASLLFLTHSLSRQTEPAAEPAQILATPREA
ncbi:MAG: COX15/CtaA family protein [Pseudomonadota bacterium]